MVEACSWPAIDSQSPLTHYVAVLRDLPRGMLAAQVTHAAGESSPGRLPPGTHAVVLGCSGAQLAELELRLKAAGIPHSAIREVDPPYRGWLMAIGIAPCDRALVRRFLSSLPLLKEDHGS